MLGQAGSRQLWGWGWDSLAQVDTQHRPRPAAGLLQGPSGRQPCGHPGAQALTVGVGVRSLLVGHDPGGGIIDLPGERGDRVRGRWASWEAAGHPVLLCASPPWPPQRRSRGAQEEARGNVCCPPDPALARPAPGLLFPPPRGGRHHSQHWLVSSLARTQPPAQTLHSEPWLPTATRLFPQTRPLSGKPRPWEELAGGLHTGRCQASGQARPQGGC